ncbi:NAD(P)-binding protein [Astrocystis sublimbata]|nr:NAD(P)-binding protein [Astrocystis sublimbata]KAI0203439.1 NAD(P)-binding protein [Astrocystis sublimbata]
MADASPPPFDTSPEARATVGATLWRQLFVIPPRVENVDLTGKAAIVTGSNGGIGLECARQLLDLGLSRLILAVRSEEKGERAKTSLLTNSQRQDISIEVWSLDMLSYESTIAFAARAQTLGRLDIAVLNVGILKQNYQSINAHSPSSGGGHEETIQVNVISTILLSVLLLPVLRPKTASDAAPGRLVVVTSDVASFAKFKERVSQPLLPSFDDPDSFSSFERYCTSKLLGQLAISELAKRVNPSKVIITPQPWIVGTRTIIAAAVKFGPEANGQYFEDGKLQPLAPFAYKAEGIQVAQSLWNEVMEELSFSQVGEILEQESQ